MPVNPQFLAARSAEHRRRLEAYLPQALPLDLPLRSGRVVRVPQQHLTLRALIELDLIASPFVKGGPVTVFDAYRYLWRLHPDFTRGHGWRGALTRLRLAMLSARLLWPAAADLISARMDEAWQDDPDLRFKETPGTAPRRRRASRVAPQHCTPDDFLHIFSTRPAAEVLDSPVARLLQLIRAAALAAPDGYMHVNDPSAALL